jgi:integrase
MPSKIKKRGKNSYLLTVSDGYDAPGKQQVFTKTITADNITEAKTQYDLFLADCLYGKVLTAGTEKMTVKQFYHYWMEHYGNSNLEKTTIAYNDALFKRIEVVLGNIRIDKLEPRDILNLIKQLSAPDAGHGDKPLSNNTIRKHYVLVNTLLNTAVKWQFIINNPAAAVDPPKAVKPKKKILEDDALSNLLTKLEQEPINHQLWVLLAFSRGLRREEIFGLQWGDIDLKRNRLTINRAIVYVTGEGLVEKGTKSDNSCRKLSLPPTIAKMFSDWREELRARIKRRNKRRKIVNIDDPVGPGKWVFPQANEKVGHPHSFTTFLRRFCIDNKLPSASPHLFRHMAGSYLLRAGIDIATISGELGHGNKAFTLKTYIHEMQSEKDQSANAMENILIGLKPNKSKTEETTKGQA